MYALRSLNIRPASLTFRRWSRCGSAVFRGLGKNVVIVSLAKNVLDRLFIKTKALSDFSWSECCILDTDVEDNEAFPDEKFILLQAKMGGRVVICSETPVDTLAVTYNNQDIATFVQRFEIACAKVFFFNRREGVNDDFSETFPDCVYRRMSIITQVSNFA